MFEGSGDVLRVADLLPERERSLVMLVVPGDLLMLWDGKPVRSVDEVRTWISAMVSEAKLGISRRQKTSVWSRDPWQSLEVVLELAR